MTRKTDKPSKSKVKRTAIWVWLVCAFLLIGPALIGGLVRLGAATMCSPGAEPCTALPFGGILQMLLSASWAISHYSVVLLLLSTIATLALFVQRRPVEGTLSFFLLPILALALPMLLVFVSKYEGCAINPDRVGSCILWGNAMGVSFHNAATVQRQLYDLMPYLAAMTVMLGVLGWFFAQPGRKRAKPNEKMAMAMRQFTVPPGRENR